jgi:sRNA-binding carbon storage regulator CsrA
MGSEGCTPADEARDCIGIDACSLANQGAWTCNREPLRLPNREARQNKMNRATLKVDQSLTIGSDIRVTLTDIDPRGVRLIAHGRILGGANDGASFEKIYEMTVGSSVHLSPHVAVTLVSVRGDTARIDVFAPANVLIRGE